MATSVACYSFTALPDRNLLKALQVEYAHDKTPPTGCDNDPAVAIILPVARHDFFVARRAWSAPYHKFIIGLQNKCENRVRGILSFYYPSTRGLRLERLSRASNPSLVLADGPQT
jgi:hypothetical protein